MEYDRGVPSDAKTSIEALFARESVTVTKKTKNGMQDQDIIPMIRRMQISQIDVNTLIMQTRICCQNPTLNPSQLVAAVSNYLPEYTPDFSKCKRLEIMDVQEEIFR